MRRAPCLILPALLAILAAPARALEMPASASDRTALSAAVHDARLDDLPGGLVLVTPPPYQPWIGIAPHYKWRFPRALFIYAPGGREHTGLARVLTIHYALEDENAANRTARLCARLLRLHREHFNRDTAFPRGSSEADVWLARDSPPAGQTTPGGPVGGQTRDNQVYIFATGEPRTPIEWVRTTVHEWGHLTLPGARGFSAPENDAAGFLGERLYLKWLREDTLSGRTTGDDGTTPEILNLYYTRQIAPLIARFEAAGPDSRRFDAMDAAAMDLYIGGALAADNSLGSALLGHGLFTVLDVRPRDLFTALRKVIAESAVVPIHLPAWVPLQQATYRLSLDAGSVPGAVAVADRPPLRLHPGRTTELRVVLPGWKWVRPASGNITTIFLRRADAGETSS